MPPRLIESITVTLVGEEEIQRCATVRQKFNNKEIYLKGIEVLEALAQETA